MKSPPYCRLPSSDPTPRYHRYHGHGAGTTPFHEAHAAVPKGEDADAFRRRRTVANIKAGRVIWQVHGPAALATLSLSLSLSLSPSLPLSLSPSLSHLDGRVIWQVLHFTVIDPRLSPLSPSPCCAPLLLHLHRICSLVPHVYLPILSPPP